jgi:hypothetical protein
MRRRGDPVTLGDRLVGGIFIAAAATVLALDVVTAARFLAFAWTPPAVHDVEARIREDAQQGRGQGSALRVETNNGWIAVTTGPSTVLGTARSGVDSQRVVQDTVAKVAWIDAPARLVNGTAHYPIRVEQSGHVLLEVDGAAGIVRAELPELLAEAGFFGAVLAALAWWQLAMGRRDALKMAAARAAWHQRRK